MENQIRSLIVIDIGGTTIKYGVVNHRGDFFIKKKVNTPNGGPLILKKVVEIVSLLIKESPETISGVGISSAGMIDPIKGEVFDAAPLIPHFIGTNFKQVIETRFHLPCEVENDVNCAGLYESKRGSAIDSHSTLCLTIGTGIGGCFILNGQLYRGFSYSACEIGYMSLNQSDFQTLGATSILTKNVAQRKKQEKELWSGEKIFEYAKKGDVVCQQAILEMCEALGKGIANCCYVLNPQMIVLGGGVMAQKDYLMPLIKQALKKYLVSSIYQKTTLTVAKAGNNAGMLGAYYHFLERQLKEK